MGDRWGKKAASVALLAVLAGCAGNDLNVVANPNSTTSSTATPTTEQGLTAAPAPTTTTVPPTTTTTAPPPPPSTTTTAPPSTDPPPAPQPPTAGEGSLAFVNQKRAEHGVEAVRWDAELAAAAQRWAEQLATDKDLRHNPNLGQEIPGGYMSWGENVGYAGSAGQIDQGWWGSTGHRENILRGRYTAIGVAFVTDGEGTVWGVQVFAGS